MANTNCLEGIRCPNCGAFEPFHIQVKQLVCMSDDGSDESRNYDIEWEEDSFIECDGCHHTGTIADFKDVDNAGRFKICSACGDDTNIDYMELKDDEWVCNDCLRKARIARERAVGNIRKIIKAGAVDEDTVVVRDTIANLIHWCEDQGLDFENELRVARDFFESECRGED